MDVYSVPKDFDNLLPEDIDLTMFSIQNLTLFKQKQLVIMSIVLKRKVATELLTTYLPTILLLLITFITVFFDKALFGDAIAVNLTIMLVMTTIFTSKIEELPPTSDMKMIDIWLIFCLIVPFLEVILRTAIECFTCDCQVCEPKENDENDKAGDGEVGEKNDPDFLHGSSTLRVGTGVKVAPKQVALDNWDYYKDINYSTFGYGGTPKNLIAGHLLFFYNLSGAQRKPWSRQRKVLETEGAQIGSTDRWYFMRKEKNW